MRRIRSATLPTYPMKWASIFSVVLLSSLAGSSSSEGFVCTSLV